MNKGKEEMNEKGDYFTTDDSPYTTFLQIVAVKDYYRDIIIRVITD